MFHYRFLMRILSALFLFLSSCDNLDRISRVYFVEKLLREPENMNFIVDTSYYNCAFYIDELFVDDLIKSNYYYYGEESYQQPTTEKFINGKWISSEEKYPTHDIVVKSNKHYNKYYTFRFIYEDKKWCLRRILPYNTMEILILPDLE